MVTHRLCVSLSLSVSKQVEKELRSEKYHEEDVKHLKKILSWANMLYYGGLGARFAPQLGVAQAFGAKRFRRRVYDVHGDLREVDDGWPPRVPRRV